jgi:hypothetical protein
MNRTLKSALVELRSDGVNLDPVADLDFILTLNTLSLQISTPGTAPGEAAALRPVLRVGNVILRRLSIGARRFLVDVVAVWFPSDTRMQDMAYAYCMAVGNEPASLWAVQGDRRAFEKQLKAWEKTIGVSYDDLKTSIREYLASDIEKTAKPGMSDYRTALGILDGWKPLPENYMNVAKAELAAMEAEVDSTGISYGPMLEMMVREYGETPEHWLWKVSSAEIGMLLSAKTERLDAEARAVSGARDDRFQNAHHAFVQYVELVRRIKKGAAK